MDFASMDEKTAFYRGFADRCFDEGLSPEAVTSRIEFFEKNAWWQALLSAAPGYASAGYKGLKDTGAALIGPAKFLAGIPLALGLAGGAGVGYGLAKMNEPDIDEDDIKAQELAQTYKIYTDRMKAQQAYNKYRQAQGQKI